MYNFGAKLSSWQHSALNPAEGLAVNAQNFAAKIKDHPSQAAAEALLTELNATYKAVSAVYSIALLKRYANHSPCCINDISGKVLDC